MTFKMKFSNQVKDYCGIISTLDRRFYSMEECFDIARHGYFIDHNKSIMLRTGKNAFAEVLAFVPFIKNSTKTFIMIGTSYRINEQAVQKIA